MRDTGIPGISLAVDLYRLTIVFGSSNICLVNVVAAASQPCVFFRPWAVSRKECQCATSNCGQGGK